MPFFNPGQNTASPHLCGSVFTIVFQYCLTSVMSSVRSYFFTSPLVLSIRLRLRPLLLSSTPPSSLVYAPSSLVYAPSSLVYAPFFSRLCPLLLFPCCSCLDLFNLYFISSKIDNALFTFFFLLLLLALMI